MDWTALTENLLFLLFGAIAGLFGSIGLEWWKRRAEQKELKDRIREELEIALRDIKLEYEKNTPFRNFFADIFEFLQNDLIRKVNVSTYRTISETYDKIRLLENQSNIPEQNEKNYKDAIEALTKTIKLLK